MHKLIPNFSLRDYNSFGLEIRTDYWLTLTGPEDWKAAMEAYPHIAGEEKLILGGGTNLLFLHDFEGVVLSPLNYGFHILRQDGQHVEVEVGAGEEWDDFVAWTVQQNWYGAENLSMIPGKVGAAPFQNIGAYGVEAASIIEEVKGFDLVTCRPESYSNEQCNFSYRSSYFKENLANRFLITSVVFRLKKHGDLNTHYGDIKNTLADIGEPSLQNLRKAVIQLRGYKLPDPKKLGNAGSFFKNPVVTEEVAAALAELLPGLPVYQSSEGYVKISAGFLIDKAGWKGYRLGAAAVHDRQALVLVNTGRSNGHEILRLANMLKQDIFEKFGVLLEPEVQVIGSEE